MQREDLHPGSSRDRWRGEGTIFVGGYPRSGTTFLGRCLGSHPDVAYWEEPRLLETLKKQSRRNRRLVRHLQVDARADLEAAPRYGNLRGAFGETVETPSSERQELVVGAATTVLEYWRRSFLDISGGSVLLEKTPMGVTRFPWAAEVFPSATLVHIVRDVRDVLCSVQDWDGWWGRPGWLPEEGELPTVVGEQWASIVGDALSAEERFPGQILRIGYEQLVREPKDTLSHILDAVGLAYTPALDRFLATGMEGLDPTSVGRWRHELRPEDASEVERAAGATLQRLGYEPGGPPGRGQPGDGGHHRQEAPAPATIPAGDGQRGGGEASAVASAAPVTDDLEEARREIAALERRIDRLRRRNRRLAEAERVFREEITALEAQLTALRASSTWRVGAAVTWLPRRLKQQGRAR